MSVNPVVSVVRYRASDWVDGLAVEEVFFKKTLPSDCH